VQTGIKSFEKFTKDKVPQFYTDSLNHHVPQSTDSECGVCIWLRQWHVLEKADCHLFKISKFLHAFCVSEITQLFSVVFCVVRAVHKFEFGFL
jgi:hypothetical protein